MPLDMSEPIDFDVASLPERTVERADFAVSLGLVRPDRTVEPVVVVAGADTHELVRVSVPVRNGRTLRYLTLAPGGREILVEDTRAESVNRLCLLDLGTGTQRWFDTDADTYGAGVRASVSPDGRSIGTVLVAYDRADRYDETSSLAVVSVIDVNSGSSRRLFAASGGWGGDSGFAWSPDQKFAAATYVASPDDEYPQEMFTTVVLDLSGKVITRMVDATIAPAANSAWLDDHTLLWTLDAGLATFDALSAQVGPSPVASGVKARNGHRLILLSMPRDWDEPTRLITTAFDGTDEKPWITINSPLTGIAIDFA